MMRDNKPSNNFTAMLSELLGVLGFVLQRMRTLSLGKLLAEKADDTDNDSEIDVYF